VTNADSAGPDGVWRLVDLLKRRFDAANDHEAVPKEAVVLVLGAGASLESGKPTWGDARLRRSLVAAIGDRYGRGDEFVDEAWARLAHLLPESLPREVAMQERKKEHLVQSARTDHLCWAAGALAAWRGRLLAFLQKTYGPNKDEVQPQLGYELIAHLMKHRFVDHVITMNFDEVLDASLTDELGPDGYRLVMPGVTSRSPGPGLPHLFKLHGTISDSDSLRFGERSSALSPSMEEQLDKVIFPGEDPAHRVWFVSLGYSWSDIDAASWLAGHGARVAGVICGALKRNTANELARRLATEVVEAPDTTIPVVAIAAEELNAEEPPTVDELLWAVWCEVRRREHPMSPGGEGAARHPRMPSAARHILLSHLFSPPQGSPRWWPAVYDTYATECRLEAEVLLTTGKTDGLVTLSSLARDARINGHWEGIDRTKGPLLERLTFLRRSTFPDVTEVFFFAGDETDYAEFFARAGKEGLPLSGQVVAGLDRALMEPYLADGELRRRERPYAELLSHYLGKVFRGQSVEVDPRGDRRADLLFRQPRPLRTHKTFVDHTDAIVQHDGVEALLVIAESGRWLEARHDLLARLGSDNILLIEASQHALEGWTARKEVQFEPSRVLRIGLPWWMHNRHLTLTIGASGEPLAGVYFRRRERTPRISPIGIEDTRDLDELVVMFCSYMARYYEEFAKRTPYPDAPRFYRRFRDLGVVTRLLDGKAAPWAERLGAAWRTYARTRKLRPAVVRVTDERVLPGRPVDRDGPPGEEREPAPGA